MGVNAIRSAHHPATPELLDACDRLGVLVISEHRVMGTTPELRHELERLVRRDRNHPSVILWSVGNEEAIGNHELGTRLRARCPSSAGSTPRAGHAGGLQLRPARGHLRRVRDPGFNYKAQHDIDAMHRRFPRAARRRHRRRPDPRHARHLRGPTPHAFLLRLRPAPPAVPAPHRLSRPGASTSNGPYIAGAFYWTGFDYAARPPPTAGPPSRPSSACWTPPVSSRTAASTRAAWTQEPDGSCCRTGPGPA